MSTIHVPPSPQTLQQIAEGSGGQSFSVASDSRLKRGLPAARLAARPQVGGSRDHGRVRRQCRAAPARRRRHVDVLVPEARCEAAGSARRRRSGRVRRSPSSPRPPARRTSAAASRSACTLPGPGSSCRPGTPRPRPRVEYQLTCPKGYVVGGLDAELTDRAIDVTFQGLIGAPVNPGITTSRTALFVAHVGADARARRHVPAAHRLHAERGRRLEDPDRPPRRPARATPTRAASRPCASCRDRRRCTKACAAGETLVSATHAIGFFTAEPPTTGLVASVRSSQTIRGSRVFVSRARRRRGRERPSGRPGRSHLRRWRMSFAQPLFLLCAARRAARDRPLPARPAAPGQVRGQVHEHGRARERRRRSAARGAATSPRSSSCSRSPRSASRSPGRSGRHSSRASRRP